MTHYWTGTFQQCWPFTRILFNLSVLSRKGSTFLELESTEHESTKCWGQTTTFLLLWPAAFKILPFKVRPHSVSLYSNASFIPVSQGLIGSPRVSFYKLPPASHAITSAGNFRAGSFPRTVKQQLVAIHLTLCLGELLHFQVCTVELRPGNKEEQHTA